MFSNCCSACEKDTLISTSEHITPRKQLIMMFSQKHKKKYPPKQVTFHEESSISPTNLKSLRQVRPLTDRQSSKGQDTTIGTNAYGVHSIGPTKRSRKLKQRHAYTNITATIVQPQAESSSRTRKTASTHEINENYKHVRLNVEDEYGKFKQSNIIEVHCPRVDQRSYSQHGSISKQPKRPFEQIGMISLPSNKLLQQSQPTEILSVGVLLGRGKYCNVYLCQDKKTNFMFALKHIFNKQSSFVLTSTSVSNTMKLLLELDHPSIASIYKISEDKNKISVYQEYLPTLLYDQLMTVKQLPIQTVRCYLKQIIEVIVILHQNYKSHGNLTPLHIGSTMGLCKVRISLINSVQTRPNYLKDIHYLGILGYQMAYGFNRRSQSNDSSFDDFQYFDNPRFRSDLIRDILQKQASSREYSQLDSFLLYLLEQRNNLRISGSGCLTHPFFEGQK